MTEQTFFMVINSALGEVFAGIIPIAWVLFICIAVPIFALRAVTASNFVLLNVTQIIIKFLIDMVLGVFFVFIFAIVASNNDINLYNIMALFFAVYLTDVMIKNIFHAVFLTVFEDVKMYRVTLSPLVILMTVTNDIGTIAMISFMLIAFDLLSYDRRGEQLWATVEVMFARRFAQKSLPA